MASETDREKDNVQEFNQMRPVEPTRTPAGYIGGKRNLARLVTALIEATPHQTYAEAFVGMGGIFLKRRTAPPAEVINDYSGDVATFFRILQRHYTPFMEMLRYQVTSRREFERLRACDPATLTDLERAARFLYLQRLAFGGKVAGRNFGVSAGMSARFNVTKLAPMLEDVHERLAGVVIEQLRWQDFITRYDRPGTLFYLDPPYWGCEGDYGKAMFSRGEFEEMATRLRDLKGRFVMSINDVPEIRGLFTGFDLQGVELTYTVAGGRNAVPARELVITSGAGPE
jgi:DNA adenine methylase